MPLPEPRHSCPMFDDAIAAVEEALTALDNAKEQIENGRSINSTLRDWGTSWMEHAEDLEKEKDLRIAELEKDVAQLSDRVNELREERDDLRVQIDDLKAITGQ